MEENQVQKKEWIMPEIIDLNVYKTAKPVLGPPETTPSVGNS